MNKHTHTYTHEYERKCAHTHLWLQDLQQLDQVDVAHDERVRYRADA